MKMMRIAMSKKSISEKSMTTYERLIKEDPKFEEDLNKGYKKLVLSELLLAIMQEDKKSIRILAKEAGVSPSLIQDLKTKKKENLTFRSFSNIFNALGYDIILQRRKKQSHTLNKIKLASMQKNIDESYAVKSRK